MGDCFGVQIKTCDHNMGHNAVKCICTRTKDEIYNNSKLLTTTELLNCIIVEIDHQTVRYSCVCLSVSTRAP